MSILLRFTEREVNAGSFLTRIECLPPLNSIYETVVWQVINGGYIRYNKPKSLLELCNENEGGTTCINSSLSRAGFFIFFQQMKE